MIGYECKFNEKWQYSIELTQLIDIDISWKAHTKSFKPQNFSTSLLTQFVELVFS